MIWFTFMSACPWPKFLLRLARCGYAPKNLVNVVFAMVYWKWSVLTRQRTALNNARNSSRNPFHYFCYVCQIYSVLTNMFLIRLLNSQFRGTVPLSQRIFLISLISLCVIGSLFRFGHIEGLYAFEIFLFYDHCENYVTITRFHAYAHTRTMVFDISKYSSRYPLKPIPNRSKRHYFLLCLSMQIICIGFYFIYCK